MSKNDVKKYNDFIKEANETPVDDANTTALSANVVAYNKYKNRVVSMFNNAKAEDMEKITKDFENFVNGLSEGEKGASDMLRTLFSSEKIKVDIKALEEQKQNIEEQIQKRIDELKKIGQQVQK